ncbi:hypothetical protein ACIOHS_01145 [Streptomyces sp. NPDC088253]|uniref:hypothetical protein n=1 Tax=Streptomyces sp. NPDC088253 TaxID=3365846 RepID=UPI00382C581E
MDDTGTFGLVNAETEALFGYGRQELLGPTADLLVPDRFRAHHSPHRAAPATPKIVRRVRWAQGPPRQGPHLLGLRRTGRRRKDDLACARTRRLTGRRWRCPSRWTGPSRSGRVPSPCGTRRP